MLIYISFLTMEDSELMPNLGIEDAKSLFRKILRVSPYSSKILRVVWP